MTLRSRKEDILALPEAYRVFHGRISPPIPPSRIFCDPFRTLAFGTDASFYRLVPKIVVKVNTREEVAHLLRTADLLHRRKSRWNRGSSEPRPMPDSRRTGGRSVRIPRRSIIA
jgi:hypothetical protein